MWWQKCWEEVLVGWMGGQMLQKAIPKGNGIKLDGVHILHELIRTMTSPHSFKKAKPKSLPHNPTIPRIHPASMQACCCWTAVVIADHSATPILLFTVVGLSSSRQLSHPTYPLPLLSSLCILCSTCPCNPLCVEMAR
jgi:hypothetical protein